MTIVGLLMLVVFGFLAVRHFRNGRVVWGILAGIGSLLGAASLWVDYQRGNADAEPPSTVQPTPTSAEPTPVIGDYDPDADYSDGGESSAASESGEDAS